MSANTEIRKKLIYDSLEASLSYADELSENLTDNVLLTEYTKLVYKKNGLDVWDNALQHALLEHEVVIIPPSDNVYYISKTIILTSNRRIEAYGATVFLTEDCDVIMFRNEHTHDGTHSPISGVDSDNNISICGGTWGESKNVRLGYGKSGKYDNDRSFYGVSTCFFFDNVTNITIVDVTFKHTAGFSVQIGNIKGGKFENIVFVKCFADGLHINGNCDNIVVRNVSGQVGDDIVALNMYDWQNSSVCFGPINNILVENVTLSSDSECKAIRIEPGIYYYDDGSFVDCSLRNAIIRKISGIEVFKLYFQTPVYNVNETKTERGGIGSGDNIFFEDMDIELVRPAEYFFSEYANSDPIRGHFGVFEICANINYMALENINVTLPRRKYPLSHVVSIGPKSCRGDKAEFFDPYLGNIIKTIEFNNVKINGKAEYDIDYIIHTTDFDNINNDGMSTAKGEVENIIINGEEYIM